MLFKQPHQPFPRNLTRAPFVLILIAMREINLSIMGKEVDAFVTGRYHCFLHSISCCVVFSNINTVFIYLFKYFRKLLSLKCIISIIIASICLPRAHTHNNNHRYNVLLTPRNAFSLRRTNIIFSVPLRGYFSATQNSQKDTLRHGTIPRSASSRISNNNSSRKSPVIQRERKLLHYSRNLPEHISEYGVETKGDAIVEGSFNASYIPEASVQIKDNVLVDSYRSSSICVGHALTHWLRDSRNCSMFFVCSRNRVAAVLTCPKNFVWSNRVTNCVPLDSRWDDCHIEDRSTQKVSEDDVGDHSIPTTDPQFSQYPVMKGYREEQQQQQIHTQSSSPPLERQQQQQQLQFPKLRRRLGYRSTGQLRDKSKRRRYGSRGYVVQLLNTRRNARRRLQRNNMNQMKRQLLPQIKKSNGESPSKRRRFHIWGEMHHNDIVHPSDNDDIPTPERRWYTDVTTTIPTTTTTPTPTVITTLRSVIIRKRKRRKNKYFKHSFIRPRLKNAIPVSHNNDFYYLSKSQDKTNHNHNPNSLEKFPVAIEQSTAEAIVTKWWKTSDVSTPEQAETTPVSPQTTVAGNTTLSGYSSQPNTTLPSPIYIPECGISAAAMIVGGMPVQDDRWPWVVSLQLTWLNRNMCGATLVHPRWLVTAAHCMAEPDLSNAEDWRVILTHVDAPAKVDYIVKHPSFVNGDNFPNDIAMLRLKHPADVTGFHVRHACLPSRKWNRSHWDKCWIMGYGEAKEDTAPALKELEVNVWKNSECAARWGWKRILNSHMCVGTGDSGACYGDSGGPLICRRNGYHFLAGVTSWGVHGCQTLGYPGVFVNVASYRQWIDDIIETRTTT